MKIFALVVVKDEADVIRPFLEHAREWAEKIFILDNGSTDGTWEILQNYNSEKIVVWKRDPRTFSNSLRGDLFRNFKDEASFGDWWCVRTDIDEFYLDNPREFLSSVPPMYNVVKKKSLEFCLTKTDYKEKEFTGEFVKDKDKIEFVKPFLWSEVRFIRHTPTLRWKKGKGSPQVAGLVYNPKILCSHYQSRSPQQIEKRFINRNTAKANTKEKIFAHVSSGNWKDELWDIKDTLNISNLEDINKLPIKMEKKKFFLKQWLINFLKFISFKPR